MGFRCYSEVAGVSTDKGPKLGINLTLTHYSMASEITGARCAISDKCSVADFNTPSFSSFLSCSLVSFAVPFCQVAYRRKSQMSVPAYWGK